MKTTTNVASEKMGAKVVFATDDFFAPASRMLQDSEPLWIEDKFDDHGKWMDGWESRRKRDDGYDFCIVKLAKRSTIESFNLDTTHFTGNFPPAASIDGCCVGDDTTSDELAHGNIVWTNLLAYNKLRGNSHNKFNIDKMSMEITHIRLNIYPDGGIARLRVNGTPCFNVSLYGQSNINVTSIYNGATALYANDEHFGKLQNILFEHNPINMADGWETRRRREPGNDWGIIALPRPAIISAIIIETTFFKGNYPDKFDIKATSTNNTITKALITNSMFWQPLIAKQTLQMNNSHSFDNSYILTDEKITHIRLNIYPDGGISRLKLIGRFVDG